MEGEYQVGPDRNVLGSAVEKFVELTGTARKRGFHAQSLG